MTHSVRRKHPKLIPDVTAEGYKIISDLPDRLPITEEELDLLETELSGFIEELLVQAR